MKARRIQSALMALAVAFATNILALDRVRRHWPATEVIAPHDAPAARPGASIASPGTPATRPATAPAAAAASGTSMAAARDLREQMLREAIELLDDADLPAALRALRQRRRPAGVIERS